MEAAWTEVEVVHLLLRATFSASPGEVEACLRLGREETVDRLVRGVSLTGQAGAIRLLTEVKSDGKNLNPDKIVDQQLYWLYRMANTQAPLIEKMALFWHGHFATSYQKVKETALMVRQNELFRSKALGSFHDLVNDVGKDPAMMIFLDSNSNRKGKPNENYAREVMELFTLGIGNYTEEDVREAARSLTGWNYNKVTDAVAFNAKQHDTGGKTVLQETGNFDESDLVNVLFRQQVLPQFMAKKLLRYFGAPEPAQDWVDVVANDFNREKTVGEVLRQLFLSGRFYAPDNRQALIKSPAEYVAGIVKAFDLPLTAGYAEAMRKMGQMLYLPPDVAGWPGGAAWLMTTNLLARYQYSENVAKRVKPSLLTSPAYQPAANDAGAWVALWGRNACVWTLNAPTTDALVKYADDTFVHAQQKNAGMRGLLQLLLSSPEAQMK